MTTQSPARPESKNGTPKSSAAGTTIRRVTVDKVFVPFVHEVKWSAGTRPGTTRLVVAVETEDGAVGVGETICLLEFIEPVLIKTIVPLAIGEDACAIERLVRKVEGAGYYHHKRAMVMARAGLEMACWDVIGKRAKLPLHRLWGGGYRDKIAVAAYVQSDDPAFAAREAAAAAARGFGTVKVKVGMGEQLDVELVRAVREAVGPAVKVRADANGAWTVGTAKRMLRKLEPFDLEYMEQPLPLEDIRGHAHLRQCCGVPIALDESAYTLQDVHAIIEAGAADMVLIDPHEAGGLLQARKMAAVCEAGGLPVTLHSGGELGIGTAAYLHLAATIPNLLSAIDLQYPNISGDVVATKFGCENGVMTPPAGPGLGVELDPAALELYRTRVIPNPYLDPSRPGWFTTKPAY